MKLTQNSLKNPAAVVVVAAMAIVLGIVMLTRLPIQLFPAIERPQLSVQTFWRGASPSEMESEIIEPIEEVMQGLPGLEDLRTFSNPSSGFVLLEFALEADMDRTLLEVISRLNRLPPLPADADKPQILMNGGGNSGPAESLIFLFTQFREDSPLAQEDYVSFIENNVAPRLEAIEGVGSVQVNGGNNNSDQLLIEFDPVRAAELGVDLNSIPQRVGRTVDSSGGYMDDGRRRYMLNFQGRYEPDELRSLILLWRDGSPVTLGDIAEISIAPPESNQIVYQNGNRAIGMLLLRETGANVLETIDRITAEIDSMNAGILAQQGIRIEKSFDPSVFIKRAINLLGSNLVIGILLAVGVLWWFLRQVKATLLIALTIPICLLTTVIMLALFDRTVNVISLAGMAFATGMVLDAAIVVLENIVRLREQGEKASVASLLGAEQVWGALLASTITTVAIFIPILFLKDAEGQLFADLAITIAVGVGISLIVAVTVLPVAAEHWLKKLPANENAGQRAQRTASRLMSLSKTPLRRIVLVATLMSSAVGLSWYLLPNLNYLPPVKRDAVDAFISFPAGINLETADREIVSVILERLEPYLSGEKQPQLKNYYFFTFPGGGSIGVRAQDQGQVAELERIINEEILVGFPDVFAFAQQGNLFGGFGGDGSVQLNVHSRDLDALKDVTRATMGFIAEALPGARAQPNPDPNVTSPEMRIIPNDRRLAEVGYTRANIARVVRALGDGLWLGEHFDGERRLDMILKAEEFTDPELLRRVPVATPLGGTVPLGDLVTFERGVGPNFIQRVDRRRTVTFNISQPDGMALEDMVVILKQEVEPKIKPLLPAGATVSYGGSADALDRAVSSLSLNFILALGLLFMILAGLFRSTTDALFVVITIPLATVGGVLGLNVLNLFAFTPLDLLTMIGFIILLGLVVNNAILLVSQTRSGEDEGLSRAEAIERALALRLRPIFMSTLTSIMGMLPLVLFPGAGSDIYRGMATTIVGGMCVSTIFTLILLPSLLRLNEEGSLVNLFRRSSHEIKPAE